MNPFCGPPASSGVPEALSLDRRPATSSGVNLAIRIPGRKSYRYLQQGHFRPIAKESRP